MLVGDGSGSLYYKSSGWACIYYDYHDQKLEKLQGGCSVGTNNYAELQPFVNGLYYDYCLNNKNFCEKTKKVTIISDSELTIRCGNGEYQRKENLFLWNSISFFETVYDIQWKHVPRNSNPLNKLCDEISKIRRKEYE